MLEEVVFMGCCFKKRESSVLGVLAGIFGRSHIRASKSTMNFLLRGFWQVEIRRF